MSSIASFSSLMAAAMEFTPTGPPLNLSMIVRFEQRHGRARDVAGDAAVGAYLRVVTHAPEQPVGDARRAARAPRNLHRRVGVGRHAENARRAADDLLDVGVSVEVQAMDDAEARAERRRQQAGARGRADERELLQR